MNQPASPSVRVYRKTLLALIGLFFLLWIALPLVFPPARVVTDLITLPARQLGIFVHEMGHGLGAVLSGGSFHWFQMELMRGGLAITSGGWRTFTLLGGLLGPSLFGAALLIASTRERGPKLMMVLLMVYFVVGIFYMLKPVLWIARSDLNQFGWTPMHLSSLVVPCGALALTLFLATRSENWQRLYLQSLGILMFFSGYSDTRYIFRYAPIGEGQFSDSRSLAGLFWLNAETVPYPWFLVFACAISVGNFALMLWGLKRALQIDPDQTV